MFNLKSAFWGSCSAFLMAFSSYAVEIGPDSISLDNVLTHSYTIQGLKPVQGSYKLARVQYLPDMIDSENGWAGRSIPSNSGGGGRNDCSAYTLTSCPSNAICSPCPFDVRKMRFNSCKEGYVEVYQDQSIDSNARSVDISNGSTSYKTLSANMATARPDLAVSFRCVKQSCSSLNSSYVDSIPANKICDKFVEAGLTCYKNCRSVSCSGYTASCSDPIPHVGAIAMCPDCMDPAVANCSSNVCKVTGCMIDYKVNLTGTGCVEKNDNCPNGYYKTCQTGVDESSSPYLTEKESYCYKCKPAPVETCESQIKAKGSNYYPISSVNDLDINDEGKYKASDVLVLMNDIRLASNSYAVIASNVESASKYNGTLSACSSQTTMKKLISDGDNNIIVFKPKSAIQVSVPVETRNGGVYGNVTFNESYTSSVTEISDTDENKHITVTFKKPVQILDFNINVADTVTFEDTLTSNTIAVASNYFNFKKSIKTGLLYNAGVINTLYTDSKGCRVSAGGTFTLDFNNVAFTAMPSACVNNVTTDGAKCTYSDFTSITYNNSCKVNNSQKCLDEGYKLESDWISTKPTAANDTIIPSTMLANFMKKVFSVKSAMAVPNGVTPTIKIDWTVDPDPVTPVTPPADNPVLIDEDTGTYYEWETTATCPYDSSYVKGKWVKKDCPSTCRECTSATTCTKCKLNYSLSNGKCTLSGISACTAFDYCSECSATACTKCKTGYDLTSGHCCETGYTWNSAKNDCQLLQLTPNPAFCSTGQVLCINANNEDCCCPASQPNACRNTSDDRLICVCKAHYNDY